MKELNILTILVLIFSGQHCEVDINECQSMPCKNGGSCKDQQNGYRCFCLQQFRGVNCEHVGRYRILCIEGLMEDLLYLLHHLEMKILVGIFL